MIEWCTLFIGIMRMTLPFCLEVTGADARKDSGAASNDDSESTSLNVRRAAARDESGATSLYTDEI